MNDHNIYCIILNIIFYIHVKILYTIFKQSRIVEKFQVIGTELTRSQYHWNIPFRITSYLHYQRNIAVYFNTTDTKSPKRLYPSIVNTFFYYFFPRREIHSLNIVFGQRFARGLRSFIIDRQTTETAQRTSTIPTAEKNFALRYRSPKNKKE